MRGMRDRLGPRDQWGLVAGGACGPQEVRAPIPPRKTGCRLIRLFSEENMGGAITSTAMPAMWKTEYRGAESQIHRAKHRMSAEQAQTVHGDSNRHRRPDIRR